MKILKKILFVLLFLVLIVVVSIAVYGYYLKPKYEGEATLHHINQQTTVYFDDYGVPHIYANTQKDAMVTLGYVHAQDRLWQMELMRRIAPGNLSEIFGDVMLKNDKFFKGLGIDEHSEKAVKALDTNSESYQLTLAYLEGVNQFLEEGTTPIEYQLLGIEKKKFTIKDVHNIFGYMAFSFAMAQKTDPLLSDIRDELGEKYLIDFGLNGALNTTQIKNFDGKANDFAVIAKEITHLLEVNPMPPFIGSNSWVIGGKKTKSGKVIFANDPHIMFSQPCTWYEAHIVVPDYEIYGYYLAGTPFPLLGHNRDYAYGLTMFENDDLDLFLEENNPENALQYKTSDGFQLYQTVKKTIKIKDAPNQVIEVKISKHGPLMNGFVDGLTADKPIAMHWIYTQEDNPILEAVYALSHSKDITTFSESVGLIASPGLNIMYGDAKGNIAWITSGKLYQMNDGVNPNFILNGANGLDEKKEFLDFSKNPKAINPSWNYVYSSNNQPEAVDGYLYPGYYLPEDRAKRITYLLDNKEDWTKEEVCQMMNDNTSMVAVETIQLWLKLLEKESFSENEARAITLFKKWKGTNNLSDVAPTIYNKWVYHYLKNTFEDELGEEKFKLFLGTHIMKQTIAKQNQNEKSIWWDDINSKDKKETQQDIIKKSFQEAIVALELQLGQDVSAWTWNKVHRLEHKHPLGEVAAFRSYFNVGPFEVPGANETINNLMYDYPDDGIYKVKGGPSTRRVIDFSDIENSLSILPTGQSGNPTSKHYNDQAQIYVDGKFRKMMLNKKDIVNKGTKLIFNPN